MTRRIVLIFLITFSLGQVAAQQQIKGVTKSISSVSTDKGTKYYGNKNEPPRAIEFNERSLASANFLVNINSYFDIPIEFTFTETESTTDNLGMRHRFLQQNYKGIPLEGMGYRVHERNGFVTSANGKAVRSMNINTQATLSERQCFQLAVQYLQTKDTTVQRGRKLIVSKGFAFSPESFFLAYQFDVDVSLVERWRISIDARSGQVVNKVSLVNNCFMEKKKHHQLPYGRGLGLTNYYGMQTIPIETFDNDSSRLVGETENGGKIETYDYANASLWAWIFGANVPLHNFYSSTYVYTDPRHQTAVSVHWAAEKTFEYYFKNHSRNSYDNIGSTIRLLVHVDQNLDNAFWSRNTLLFGDGSNNNPLVELDVVGHEFTHGVTQYEAGLQYLNEPGALNESFSDIFGKAIEFDTFNPDFAVE
jgi:Zn-dependent metalloprotease